MRARNVIITTTVILLFSFPVPATQADPVDEALHTADDVFMQVWDEHHGLVFERGIEPTNPELIYIKHFMREANFFAKGGKPGGSGGGGGGGGNDCTSDKYRLTGHHWTQPWSAKASNYASVLNAAGQTWAAQTGANIFGGITSGSSATAGVQDFVNQIDWTYLGAGGTVAVTTTWYYRGSGEAVESDAQYNTYYNWATNGDPNAMDVAHVGTHEIGHTFGLDHPSGPSSQISCLTMYAYTDYGWTHGDTLGVGDITGIQSIYGL